MKSRMSDTPQPDPPSKNLQDENHGERPLDAGAKSVLRRWYSGDRVRWEIAAAIVGVAAVTSAVLWNRFEGDRTTQVAYVYYVVGWTVMALLLWWLLLSAARGKTRLYGVAGAAAAAARFIAGCGHDGFTGEVYPVV